ncbi:MAG: hypothetical protein QX189_09435 [Methylococcales bacterium]
MNKLYQILIQTFIVTVITISATNVYAGSERDDDGKHSVTTHNYNTGVIQPYAKIHGKSYGDWGAEWWKWALSVPYSQSPITDLTGEDGSQNQQGAVWFLAGTFGTFAERTITIPAKKFIFFPLVNGENDFPCPDPNFKPASGQTMEDFLTSGITPAFDLWVTDLNKTLSAKVDGVELNSLTNYRGISQLTKFTANPDPDNLKFIDPCITGEKQVMVSDGFWLMLAPLKTGKHEIEFSAYDTLNPSFALHVIYHVTISKEAQDKR